MSNSANGGSGRHVLSQYLALAVTWGCSFLFIRIGLEGMAPAQVVLGRLGSGALALAGVCAIGRHPLPRRPQVWVHLAIIAILMCVLPFVLFAWAEQYVASGLASVLNATTPLMTMAVALIALRQERPTRIRLTGLLIGFAGVVLVLSPWASGPSAGAPGASAATASTAQGACLLATLCYGLAFVHLRRTIAPLGLPAVPVATVQVGLGAVIMLALSPLVADRPVHLSLRIVAAVLALGVFGTGFAFVWNTNIVRGWGATGASTVTYLTPVVGVAAGAAVLSERVTWNEPIGAITVVLGIAISQGVLPATMRARTPGHTAAASHSPMDGAGIGPDLPPRAGERDPDACRLP